MRLEEIYQEENLRMQIKYLSLRSEHPNSALVPISMIVLAQAHMAAQEYLLANYYP